MVVQFPGKKRYVTLEWPLTVEYVRYIYYNNQSISCCSSVEGLCAWAGAGYYSEFAPVNIHSKLHFRLNIITFSSISNLYSSSRGKKPFRFKFACKISKIFEIMYPRYSLCSVGAGNTGNHVHD